MKLIKTFQVRRLNPLKLITVVTKEKLAIKICQENFIGEGIVAAAKCLRQGYAM